MNGLCIQIEDADFMAKDPRSGSILKGHYTRSTFENLLDENGMFEMMNRVVDRALVDSAERGYDSDSITNVLLVGGSSLIPCVRRSLRHRFGDRVRFDRPLDAVALGAAAFIGGVDLLDHIQHDYWIFTKCRVGPARNRRAMVPSLISCLIRPAELILGSERHRMPLSIFGSMRKVRRLFAQVRPL